MRFIDPDGMFPNAPWMQRMNSAQPLPKLSPQAQKIVNGAKNITFGTVTMAASAAYIIKTGGVGAALGGAAGMIIGESQIALGVAQLTDGIVGNKNNEKVEQVLEMSNIAGAVAAGLGSEHANLIDAAVSLAGGIVTGGNVKTFVDAVKTISNTSKTSVIVFEALKAAGATINIHGVVGETAKERNIQNRKEKEDETQTH